MLVVFGGLAVPQPRRVGPGADTIGENSDVVRVRMPAPWKADGPVTQAKLDLDRTVRVSD